MECQLAVKEQERVRRANRAIRPRNVLAVVHEVRKIQSVILCKHDHLVKTLVHVVRVVAVDSNNLKLRRLELALQRYNVTYPCLDVRAVIANEYHKRGLTLVIVQRMRPAIHSFQCKIWSPAASFKNLRRSEEHTSELQSPYDLV